MSADEALGAPMPPPDDQDADDAYPDTDGQYADAYPNTDDQYADDAYPDTDGQYADAYPNTDGQYADDAYPNTDGQYADDAYPNTDGQYDDAYPDTDGQYAPEAYPNTDGQYGVAPPPPEVSAAPPPAAARRWEPPDWSKPPLLHKPVLEAYEGGVLKRTMKLDGRRFFLFGRNGAQADIVLPDASVSRAHAALIMSSSACFVHDLDSAHGTFLDGEGRTLPVRVESAARTAVLPCCGRRPCRPHAEPATDVVPTPLAACRSCRFHSSASA